MTTNRRLSMFGLRFAAIAAVFAGGVSVAAADNWAYRSDGVSGKGCYLWKYRKYQQYPCFFPVRVYQYDKCQKNVRWNGRSPSVAVDGTLHRSSLKGEMELVEKLLNAGANPNATNSFGYAPLHVAVSAGQTAIVEALLNAGANPDVVPSESSEAGATLKHCAGMTPLHFAAHGGHAEIIDALLAAGADPNAADGAGTAPLYWSDKAGHVDATVSLLAGGGTQ